MPSVIITERARDGLERCREFLVPLDPQAAIRAGQVIGEGLKILEQFPDAGQADEVYPELQHLVIPFGQSGYIALYQYEPASDQVFILAFRHQKEAGF